MRYLSMRPGASDRGWCGCSRAPSNDLVRLHRHTVGTLALGEAEVGVPVAVVAIQVDDDRGAVVLSPDGCS
jgi:hypothetical protein